MGHLPELIVTRYLSLRPSTLVSPYTCVVVLTEVSDQQRRPTPAWAVLQSHPDPHALTSLPGLVRAPAYAILTNETDLQRAHTICPSSLPPQKKNPLTCHEDKDRGRTAAKNLTESFNDTTSNAMTSSAGHAPSVADCALPFRKAPIAKRSSTSPRPTPPRLDSPCVGALPGD